MRKKDNSTDIVARVPGDTYNSLNASPSVSQSTLPFTTIHKNISFSYKCIYSLQLYVYLYIFRPLFHNPHFPITILTTTKLIGQGKKNARCVWHQKLFLLFMTHLFYWGKNGKLVAGVMLTKRLCLISSSRPPHIVKIENCKSVYWIPRPK